MCLGEFLDVVPAVQKREQNEYAHTGRLKERELRPLAQEGAVRDVLS